MIHKKAGLIAFVHIADRPKECDNNRLIFSIDLVDCSIRSSDMKPIPVPASFQLLLISAESRIRIYSQQIQCCQTSEIILSI